MALADILNPADFDPERVEKEIQAGGLIPKGLYHAALVAAEEKAAGSNMKTEMIFQILSGQFEGRKVRRDLFHEGSDSEKDKKTKNELIHFATRLGVMVKGQDANGKTTYLFAPGKAGFEDALQTECVVEVGHEHWTRNDPNSDLVARVKMFGIHALNDPKGEACLKALGLAPPPGPPPAPAAGDLNAHPRPASGANGTTAQPPATTAANGAGAAPVAGRKRFDTSKL